MQNPDLPEAPPADVTVALLDADGTYRGIQTIAESALTADHVKVPSDCDLQPGRYLWSREHNRFDPLTENQMATSEAPSMERVVYELVLLAQASGAQSPVLAKYEAAFRLSIDAVGGVR